MDYIVLNDKELSIYQGSIKTIQKMAFETIKTIKETINLRPFLGSFFEFVIVSTIFSVSFLL